MISTSKIRKISVMKKNCVENGVRFCVIFRKPHSNGLHFSFLSFFWVDTAVARRVSPVVNSRIVTILFEMSGWLFRLEIERMV